MIALIAALYWLLLAVTGDPTRQSSIKQSYPEITLITQVRDRFLESLGGVSKDAEGLVAGLTIGVRDMVSPELAGSMRDLSLTHLIAVSGANLAIVMGVVYLLTAALGLSRNLRFLLAFGVMGCYVLLVGPESSVIRAAVMAIFVGFAIWLGRGTKPIYGLALAIVALLAIDPALALDVGFALSALATAGLLILAPLLYERLALRMPKWLAVGIAATVSAQLYTLPVLLILQPTLPIYSVVANLLVEPVVAPITILGLASVLLATLLPPLALPIGYIASIAAQWIVLVAQSLGSLPVTRLHFVPGAAGIALVVGLTIVLTLLLLPGFTRYRPGLIALLVGLSALTAGWVIRDLVRVQNFAGDWEVLVCDVGQGDAVLLRSAGRVALVDVGKDEAALSRCLGTGGVGQIDLLFLTHFDLDHVGAVNALNSLPVGQVLVSGFADDRPAVDLVHGLFSEKKVPVAVGYAGLSGELGEARWQILSPSQSAVETVDSNDASLVTFFDFPGFSFLGLGDLGESGQLRLIAQHRSLLHKLSTRPTVLKIAHHGSADQATELTSLVGADLAVFSVGKNDYGHPTKKALDQARAAGSIVLRTDGLGSIAIGMVDERLSFRVAGKLTE